MTKVTFEREGDVGVITLADPPLNLFSMELIEELDAATTEAEASQVRALLVRAEGENFSAGAQVDDVFQGLSAEQAEERLVGFKEMMRSSERLPFPRLAAVRGLCLAAGLETVLALDLIWASENAMFAFAEPVIGLTPPAGGVFRLAARAGAGRAVESVLTGRGLIRRRRWRTGASSTACLPTRTWTRRRWPSPRSWRKVPPALTTCMCRAV
jgi:enoyl-CoA hydratase/carnithine racemase